MSDSGVFEVTAGAAAAAGSGAVTRRALLVGINAYPRHPLRGCLNDVAAVRSFLEQERGFAAADIITLCDAQATRAAIMGELRAAAAATTSGDGFVFYFCGHGAQLPSEDPREADLLDEVLCPIDFAWTPATAIVDDELQQIFDSIPVGASLTWVFDACHTGDIDEQLDERVAAYRGLPGAASGDAHAARLSIRERRQHRGVILTACAATERAADLAVEGEPRGAFTYHLLAAARQQPGGRVSELLAAARLALAKIGQHPEGYGPGLDAPFISIGESNPKPPEPIRTLRISVNPSVESDRHLHMYLAEARRLALTDGEFGSKMSSHGLDLSGISEGNATVLARAVKPAPRGAGMVCRIFWWGFHLEIPHGEVEAMTRSGIDQLALARMLKVVPHRAAPHVGTLVDFVVRTFSNIKQLDRGGGVFISMSSFAPDLYVTTAAPVRAQPVRRADDGHGEPLSIRM
jgi:metacaspase-1